MTKEETFLPEGESEPVVSNYMNPFQPGENKFRVLSSSVVGMEYWVDDLDNVGKRKPVRKHMDESIPMEELGVDKWGKQEAPKYFWAFSVWNYNAKKVQILEITQKSIRETMKAYIKNPKYGAPQNYDFVVTKTGEGLETDYVTVADPPEKLDPSIEKIYQSMNINLEELFLGGDPFSSEKKEDFIEGIEKDQKKLVGNDEAMEIDDAIDKAIEGKL